MAYEQLAENTENFDTCNLSITPSAQVALVDFTTYNPEVSVENGDSFYIVHNPWGDENLELLVPHDANSLISGLNQLRLPPRFTAIWHVKSRDIEFIYGPVLEEDPIRSRSFTFQYEDQVFNCQFAESSDILLLMAKHARPIGLASSSNYRNLISFRSFLRLQEGKVKKKLDSPVYTMSFWMRGVVVDENDLPDIARHINFYMRYFDRHSPQIIVHEQPRREPDIKDPVGQLSHNFPPSIRARPLEPYLLLLWESAISATEQSQRFIYNYQILEYAAFYYLKEDIFRSVRQTLAWPDAPSRPDEVARQILDIIVEDRTSDDNKIQIIFQRMVNPADLWREIERRLSFFCANTVFDGDFEVAPLVKTSWGLEDFKSAWIPKLPDIFRKLCNALVHARESRASKSINPSARNQRLLQPWVLLSEIVAQQVINSREY